ncbi:MAG: hypothetical protein U0T72_09050 [Chitinophagales bacterium]
MALGIGGFPKGRVVEIYGPEKVRQNHFGNAGNCQRSKNGGIAAFIDAEHAFDKSYAEKLGIDCANLLISQPDDQRAGIGYCRAFNSLERRYLRNDSVAALVPRSELKKAKWAKAKWDTGAAYEPGAAQTCRNCSKTGCCCIFINQLRDKIGVMFGSPKLPPVISSLNSTLRCV